MTKTSVSAPPKSEEVKASEKYLTVAILLAILILLLLLSIAAFRSAFPPPTPNEVIFSNYLNRFQSSGFNSREYNLSAGRPSFGIRITRGYQFFIVANNNIEVDYYYRGGLPKRRLINFCEDSPMENADMIQIFPVAGDTKVYLFTKINY